MAKKSNTISACCSDDLEWRTESDLRTLMDAEKIEKDPKRMKAVKELAKKKMLEVAAIASEGSDES